MPQFPDNIALPSSLAEKLDHVLVTGAGVSGVGIARLLTHCSARVTLVDSRPAALTAAAASLSVDTIEQAELERTNANLAGFSLVVTSPGWPPYNDLLQRAAQQGISVIGEVELAYLLDQAEVFGPKRTWVAITGTNGKTTTTSMAAHIATSAGLAARAVGNIGIPIADALLGPERIDILIAEFSSFQLYWTQQFVPDIGVLLNIAEDHLDWHGGYVGYASAKAKVLQAPIAIYGSDDPGIQDVLENPAHYELSIPATTQLVPFHLGAPQDGEYGMLEQDLAYGQRRICTRTGIHPAGDAGSLDALAAAAVAHALGISDADIAASLHTFQVARHRGEVVASSAGITAIDNSKATNPHAAIAALRGLHQVTWVAGGQLKGADAHSLVAAIAPQLTGVVLLGQDRQLLLEALEEQAPQLPVVVVDATDPAVAMQEVATHAVQMTKAGGSIVLAPAAASLDMYTGMAQRGDMFAAAIERALEHK